MSDYFSHDRSHGVTLRNEGRQPSQPVESFGLGGLAGAKIRFPTHSPPISPSIYNQLHTLTKTFKRIPQRLQGAGLVPRQR